VSDVDASLGLRGPAEDIYRVNAMEPDSGRNHRQSFADSGPDGDGDGSQEGKKKQENRSGALILDDVKLSEIAIRAIGEAGPVEHPETHPVKGSPMVNDTPRPGSIIDLKA
jgi:hypothetical protein